MNTLKQISVAALIAALPGLALAGSTPAGPAGGSATVGSVVQSAGGTRAMFSAGTITLAPAQITQLLAEIRALPGALTTADGAYVQAPITLDNGAAGTVSLDTDTGQLTVAKSK